MNSKQRMVEALRGGQPDRVPVAPCYLQLYLENQMGRNYLDQYRRRMGTNRRMPIDHEVDTRFRATAYYRALEVLQETPDWLPVLKVGPSYEWADTHFIERVDEDYFFVNKGNGRRLSFLDSEQIVLSPAVGELGGTPGTYGFQAVNEAHDLWDLSHDLQCVADVNAAVPVVSSEELTSRGMLELPRRIIQDDGDTRFIYASAVTPFTSLYDVLGFAGTMTTIYDRPELLPVIMERCLAQTLETLKGLAGAGVHGVWIIETQASADLISPRHFEQFALPYLQAVVEGVKALGMSTILYFCGDSMPRLGLLQDLRVDAYALEESKKTFQIDIEAVVDCVGDHASVFGNIDTIGIMARGTVDMVEREALRQINAGKRARGFVLGTGSPLPPETDPRHVDALVRVARLSGRS